MADELRNLRVNQQIPAKDIVAVVQKLYPSFDKTLLSKSERGDKYGVVLRREAWDAIINELTPEARAAVKHQRGGRHRLTHKIMCRLEKDDFDALQQLIKDAGYKTTQDWLSDIVKLYIETHGRKRVYENGRNE